MQFIVVLGNSKDDTMKKRVDRAILEYSSNLNEYNTNENNTNENNLSKSAIYIILSGTNRETTFMVNYISNFVDNKYIIIENMSKNTIENIANSKKIIDSYFSVTYGFLPSVTICTSTFHIKRSMMITKFIMTNYNTKFIHTNEHITLEHHIQESKNIENCLNYFFNHMCE